MTSDEILREINGIFIEVLGDPTINLTVDTVAKDIPKWDSLSHIQIVVGIEKHFNLRFEYSQILKWQNLGSICADVEKILAAKVRRG